MRFFTLFLLFVLGITPLVAQNNTEQEELIIEMKGPGPEKTLKPTISIWDKNAKQLFRLFKGQDKNYLLYTANSVPTKEVSVTGDTHTNYQLVQYGQDRNEYRKFLFEAAEPYAFVTCAATAADIIAIFQRYKVNLGTHQTDFLKSYPNLAAPQTWVENNQKVTCYEIPPKQLPLSAKKPVFALFEKKQLTHLLEGKEALETYKKTIKPSVPAKTKAAESRPTPPVVTQKDKPYKALLSGGTLHDKMYMPHVVSGPFTEQTNPKNTP